MNEIERDAARYRFLRDLVEGRVGERHIRGPGVCDWAKNLDPRATHNIWSSEVLTGDALDKEIDAAVTNPHSQ